MGEQFGISPLNGLTSDMVHTEATFVCADVVRFTAMTERLGDRASLRLMRRVARLVQAEAVARGGRTVELRGDSFLLVVPSGADAIACAEAIHDALERDADSQPDGGVEVRIAVHGGSVLQMREHYFGRNLILPYRLLPLLAAGETGITEAVSAGSGPRRTFLPKGFRDTVAFTVQRRRGRNAPRASRPATSGGHPTWMDRPRHEPTEARLPE